ncbi:MAG: phosphatidate cytidylyltransferase, partial [Longimicrobiales bacterium]
MTSELAKRVAVAAIGIPVAIVLLYIGGWPLALVIAAVAAGGALELYRMAAVHGTAPFNVVGAVVAALFVLLAQASALHRADWSWGLLMAATLLVAALAIWRRGVDGRPLAATATTVLGAVFVGGALSHAVALRGLGNDPTWSGAGSIVGTATGGAILLAMPFALTWFGDTFAYFGGRAWGRRKLIPSVSPGKT